MRELAKKHSIEIAKLPSHTTHLLQPLDVSTFKPLKEAYDVVAHNFFWTNRRYISKRNFPVILADAWKAFKPDMAINGFRKTGVSPFNSGVVDASSICLSAPYQHQASDQQPASSQEPSSSQQQSSDPADDFDPAADDFNPAADDFDPSDDVDPDVELDPPLTSIVELLGNEIEEVNSTSATCAPHATTLSAHTTTSPHTPGISPNKPTGAEAQPQPLRDFFTSFLMSKSPSVHQPKRKQRRLASLGESLTAEEAMKKQMEEEDRKKEEADEKERKRMMRMKKKEQKQKEMEEKEKAKEQRRKKKQEKEGECSTAQARKSGRKRKAKVIDDQSTICGICLEEWEENTVEEETWVECGLCQTWFHAECVGHGEKTSEHILNMHFTCDFC